MENAKQGPAQGAKQPPLGAADIEQINQMHAQRFQTLNPGKSLPAAFTLRPGATQADYDRIDKNLTSLESGQGTQPQREETDTFRRQQAADAADRREQAREEKYGLPVYAHDPEKKQTILTTAGAAKQNNLQAIRKVSQPTLRKTRTNSGRSVTRR